MYKVLTPADVDIAAPFEECYISYSFVAVLLQALSEIQRRNGCECECGGHDNCKYPKIGSTATSWTVKSNTNANTNIRTATTCTVSARTSATTAKGRWCASKVRKQTSTTGNNQGGWYAARYATQGNQSCSSGIRKVWAREGHGPFFEERVWRQVSGMFAFHAAAFFWQD